MLNNILNSKGVTVLDKNAQKRIKAGNPDYLDCIPILEFDLINDEINQREWCCSREEDGGGSCFVV